MVHARAQTSALVLTTLVHARAGAGAGARARARGKGKGRARARGRGKARARGKGRGKELSFKRSLIKKNLGAFQKKRYGGRLIFREGIHPSNEEN